MIGERLHQLRVERGRSVRALARETGVSATLLSQIERGLSDPSLRTLRALAGVFGTSVSTLFDDLVPVVAQVSVPGNRSRITSPVGKVQYERLAASNGQLEVLLGVLQPGEVSSDEAWSHQAIECVFVLSGTLTAEVGGEAIPVRAREAITIDSTLPHRYLNRDAERVEYTVSVSPPTP
ncbi:XRE family transcriptional regulator [Leifsonia xyli subsp. xyli]|uniref:XRE family transcriptional regulator n=1 Tax=Leifsonia xyli subsp. xyli TaxID=59736 RepID=A0A1E2SL61_LEIXY|nr:XRE family transcriptional regulator [Leifsonia xyli]ODA90378.1 XRE family transcriptional regulator [Leifsonia xyli subsp. xyli]